MPSLSLQNRYRGTLLGLAVGDAIGTTLEFRSPGTFTPIDDMIGGGPFNLLPGQWTDDTSMALCLADSLLKSKGFDPIDQLRRYVWWADGGYMSCTGECFDIGNTVRRALSTFYETQDPWSGPTSPNRAGNGSLMRLAPVAMAFAHDPTHAVTLCGQSSRTTHGAQTCVEACRYFGGLLVGAYQGLPKDQLLSPLFTPTDQDTAPYTPEIHDVASGSFLRKSPPEIRGTGYVVHALEAALWAFAHSDDFKTGCLLAANLGDDADTTAAIYGQLAGAYYGLQGIPEPWRERVVWSAAIVGTADDLYAMSQQLQAETSISLTK